MAGCKTMSINRIKELEKLAEALGAGQNREVQCVGCPAKIMIQDAIILTNKGKVAYLCTECNEKLIQGKLSQDSTDEIMKQIEALRKESDKQTIQYPPIYIGTDWKPLYGDTIIKYTDADVSYKVFSTMSTVSGTNNFLRLEPIHANRTS